LILCPDRPGSGPCRSPVAANRGGEEVSHLVVSDLRVTTPGSTLATSLIGTVVLASPRGGRGRYGICALPKYRWRDRKQEGL
jgi:hypothetical protein